MPVVGWPLFIVLGSVNVTGSSTCPTPIQVARGLQWSAGGEARQLKVELEPLPSGLAVRMRDEREQTIASKTLEATGPCAQRANVVRTLIEAWRIELEAGTL